MKLILLALLICSCAAVKPREPVATCADACARLVMLGCPAGQPTPRGASCEDVCRNVVESGVLAWNLACRSRAASCTAIDRCER